jgi:TDG/mug DNA glycosylase family protein
MARMAGLPSIVATGLDVVFCGTAVGAASAERGHYYAGPGNRFWRLLHESGLTPTLLAPEQDGTLPDHGIGLADLAPGVTQSHDRGLRFDTPALVALVERYAPRWVAFTSLTGGKAAARQLGAARPGLGEQPWPLGAARVWVLPSPSSANAAVPYPVKLAEWTALAGRLGRSPARPAVYTPSWYTPQ